MSSSSRVPVGLKLVGKTIDDSIVEGDRRGKPAININRDRD